MGDREIAEDEASAVMRSVLALARRMRSERPPSAVTPSAIGLLSTLARVGPMPATGLAAEEGLQPQSLSRLIAGLESSGCIERARSEADRRELLITLTERGREMLATDMAARRRWLEQAMAASLTGAERRMLKATAALMLKLAQHRRGPG